MCNLKKKKNCELTVTTNGFLQAGFIDSCDIWQLISLASDIHVFSKYLRTYYGSWHCFGAKGIQKEACASKEFTYGLVREADIQTNYIMCDKLNSRNKYKVQS